MIERIYAGTLREAHIGQTILLKGWVHRRRDLGDLIFIDLRDQSGIVQIVFNPDYSKTALEIAEKLRSEYVIEVTGKVIKREEDTINPNLATGQIEVTVSEVNVINKSKSLTFLIHKAQEVSENQLLKYHYIVILREEMQQSYILLHIHVIKLRDEYILLM